MAANDKNTNSIEEAERIAREAIEQAHDIAIKLDEPIEACASLTPSSSTIRTARSRKSR